LLVRAFFPRKSGTIRVNQLDTALRCAKRRAILIHRGLKKHEELFSRLFWWKLSPRFGFAFDGGSASAGLQFTGRGAEKKEKRHNTRGQLLTAHER
jgi:hypothetical protein